MKRFGFVRKDSAASSSGLGEARGATRTYPCLEAITVEEVFKAASELLELSGQGESG